MCRVAGGLGVFLIGLLTCWPSRAADAPRIVEMPAIQSDFLPAQHVRVWLPPGYDRDERRYAVIYMQDGQFAFYYRPMRMGRTSRSTRACSG